MSFKQDGIIASGPVGRTLNTIYDHTACSVQFSEKISAAIN